jgi:transcription termination/antitermination protein NusA
VEDEPRYLFMRSLGVKLSVARALESAGLTSIEEVAYIPIGELLEVKDVPEQRLMEIRNVAREVLLKSALGNRPPPWEGTNDV